MILPSNATQRILEETVVGRPVLCPELTLRLVMPDCRLWTATEPDLEALGWPEPYWAFAWAGGQALARYILDHPERFRGRAVLDFGAGGAVEGLAAARAGARRVMAVDIDPWAVEAARLNAELNQVDLETDTEDWVGRDLPGFDVVLAGDVTYGEPLTERVMAWFERLRQQGLEIWLADPGRGFLDSAPLTQVAEYEAPADVDPGGVFSVRTPIYRMA